MKLKFSDGSVIKLKKEKTGLTKYSVEMRINGEWIKGPQISEARWFNVLPAKCLNSGMCGILITLAAITAKTKSEINITDLRLLDDKKQIVSIKYYPITMRDGQTLLITWEIASPVTKSAFTQYL